MEEGFVSRGVPGVEKGRVFMSSELIIQMKCRYTKSTKYNTIKIKPEKRFTLILT